MLDKEVDFKAMVERIQAGERDYAARINTKGTDYRECPSLFVKAIDEANRQIEAVVNDASVDRDEEIILPSAFSELLGEYLKNPVIISAHQNRLETGHSSVVGQATRVWIAEDGLHVTVRFAETELGNEFWYLYKNKYQRAFSVGFIPLEWTDETVNGARVRTFTKCELLEISCVSVPSNRNALSRSKQRKRDFIADKIAQRKHAAYIGQRLADNLPKSDEDIIAELQAKGEWPIEEDCDEYAEMLSQAIKDNELTDDDKSFEDEPDYNRIVNKGTDSGLYNE